jgi:antagonist of KipI
VSLKLCEVTNPGFFTTVQDLGRFGFQRYGVPVSGAMDTYAFAAANLLVGNKPNDACLEITLIGPELLFLSEARISLTGAAFYPTIDGERVARWQTLQIHKGEALSFGSSQNGCRAYLAVRGGINVPMVLGSRSTYVRGDFGGFQGRQLRAGDVLEAHESTAPLTSRFSMPTEDVPEYTGKLLVEVVLGPQTDCFTERGLETLLSGIYEVTTESDRMGYRLEGAEVERKGSMDIVSDAIPVGAIQVPRNGKPIILMRDAQTTGGYPKIAVITTPDVSRLGQVKPRGRIQFSKVSPSKARERLLEYLKALSMLKSRLVESRL